MPGRISRRKLAEYVADGLEAKRPRVIQELAAYLLQTNRTREAQLVVRDIEDELKHRGVMIADVTSAHPLTEAVAQEITAFIRQTSPAQDPTVHLRQSVDESVLGGVRIALPGELFDGTIQHKLNALRRAKLS